MQVEFALALPSRSNARGRSIAAAKKQALQRTAARLAVQASGEVFVFPVVVTVTRISTRTLDPFDNLPGSLKSVVDGVCDALGVRDDASETRVRFVARQEKVKGLKGQRVRIEITSC